MNKLISELDSTVRYGGADRKRNKTKLQD